MTAGGPSGLVPLPEKIHWTDDEFLLRDGTPIVCPDPPRPGWRSSCRRIWRGSESGWTWRLRSGRRRRRREFACDLDGAGKKLGPEGYKLRVEGRGIEIVANAPAGLFYGVQTLLQLLPAAGVDPAVTGFLHVPCVEITDRPRFAWRGMHLDVGRHFFPWSSSRSTSTCWPATR